MKEEGFIVSVGPHVQGKESISSMMLGFIIALIPAVIAGVYYFRIKAIEVILVSVISAVAVEAALQKIMHKEVTITKDYHAILIGLLFGLILPANIPWWAVVVGVFVGLLVGKHVYGGLGSNPFNPVLVGWASLRLGFMSHMDISGSILGVVKLEGIGALAEDYSYFSEGYGIESWSSLGGKIKLLIHTLLGWKPLPGEELVGCVGQICALAIIIGAIYLFWKKYISWHIPVGFLGAVLIFSILFYKGEKEFLYPYILVQLLSGGTLLAAFFIATDPITTPVTGAGMLIFGVMAGMIAMIGRLWGSWIEPVWFAILAMNGFTPLIDRLVKPRPLGRVKSSA